MLLAMDLGLFRSGEAADYQKRLELPKDIEILEDIGDAPHLGGVDRVIWITDLSSAGRKYQRDFVRENREVTEWFILSEETEQARLKEFQRAVSSAGGQIRLFSDLEAMRAALKRRPARKNTCLLCALRELPETEDLRELLQAYLPDWSFEMAVLSAEPDAMETTDCSRVLLLGKNAEDFALPAELPPQVQPVLIALQAFGPDGEDWDSLREDAFARLGLSWGEQLQREHFFSVNVLYERWRMESETGRRPVSALETDERFVMWDAFGLPEPAAAYTPERISRFLEGFRGCAQAADRLCQA